MHLSKWAKASVYALSGGMAQRLMMARAIFHRPAVLFLDEPTAGLDPQSRLALWEILGELNARRADDPADDALHGGGRPALRPPRDHGPRQDPRARHACRAEALGRRRHDRHDQGRRRRSTRSPRGCPRRSPRSRRRARSTAASSCTSRTPAACAARRRGGRDAGFELADLSVAEPSLEDVFISLTGKELRD